MRKYTSKELKELVSSGLAIDVTNATSRNVINESYNQVGYRSGTLGIMGAVYEGLETGNLYVVTKQTKALYIF